MECIDMGRELEASRKKSKFNVICAGGAFRWVSCPHYLGEMVIYLGLTLLLDMRRPLSYLPFFWVVSSTYLCLYQCPLPALGITYHELH
jgi:protein-S-isoprenylcysteine O-methyltransferase Ste14